MVRALTGCLLALALTFWAPASAEPAKSLLRVETRYLNAPGRAEYPEAKALVLVDEIGFELQADGSTLFREHDVIKLLSQDGVEEHGELVRVYRRGDERIDVHQARTIRADGTIVEVPKENVEDVPLVPESEHYKDYRKLTIRFPEAAPDHLVEFRLETHKGAAPDRAWWATTYVQNPDPMLSSTFDVRLPGGTELHWRAPGVARSRPQKSQQEGRDVYYWDTGSEPAMEMEPSMPAVLDVLHRIDVSSFSSWEELGQWFLEGWRATVRPNQRVSLKAAGLLPVGVGAREKAQALLAWIGTEKDVVDLFVQEYRPEEPWKLLDEEVLSSLDAAGLAASLLEFAGFEVVPALAFSSQSGTVAQDLPRPSRVQRVLLRVRDTSTQQVWWVDPEHPGELLDYPPSGFQGSGALLLASEKPIMIDLPIAPPDINRQELRVESRVDRTGRAEVGLSLTQFGGSGVLWREAARELFAARRELREQTLDRLFGRMAATFSPRARVHERYFALDPEPGEPFEMAATFIIPGFATMEAEQFELPLPAQYNDRLMELVQEQGSREFPAHLDHPFRDETQIHVVLPAGTEVVSLPPSAEVENDVASFFSTVRHEGDEVWYYSRLVLKKPWISLDEYPKLLDVARQVSTAQQEGLVYKLSPEAEESGTEGIEGDGDVEE
ncbi:MAG: DUF3857 domain-containing protein [Armatimonadetes bacterium]|nr:DUF3857 domain-containing protein [Armatimonadota bacterium]